MKYDEYLLEKLYECRDALGFEDYQINIALERSFRMPKDTTTLLFVIKNLPGNYIYNIKTQPIQIIAYSELNDMTVVMQILDLFTKNYNNHSFQSDEGLIKETYDTVVTLRPMIQSETGYRASVYCYGSYVICENVADITDFKWYNENSTETNKYEIIDYIKATFVYSAVLDTQKVSGQEISTSQKKEAGASLTLVIPQTNSNFCKIVNRIMMGYVNNGVAAKGNTDFKFSFVLNGDIYTDVVYKLDNSTLATAKTDAPGLQLTFTR